MAKDDLAPSAYLGVGVARYETLLGKHDAFAYTLGVDYPLTRFLSIDAGFADFGTAHEPRIPIFTVPIITPWNGSEHRRRAGFALATFHWRPLPRLKLSVGMGPAAVFTRTRSYSTTVINPKISVVAQDRARTEFFGKFSIDFRLTDAWHLDLAAFGTNSVGFSSDMGYSLSPVPHIADSDRMNSTAVTIGLRYAGQRFKRARGEPAWSMEAGPVVSALSYHANYRGNPMGYDLAFGRKWPGGLTLMVGHTEYGVVSRRPRYPDGTPVRTPPFNESYPDGDLRVNSSSTYALLGMERNVGGRFTLGAAAGPSRTVAGFLGVAPLFGPESRYTDIVDRVTVIGQTHAKWDIGGGWQAKLAVRYTEFQGPQITHPVFEPEFGNTKVRIWSAIPALSLRF